MSWRSIVYGKESQVRETVQAWAADLERPNDQVEIIPRTLFADGYPEGEPGAEVVLDMSVPIREITELMTRLEDLTGLRPYCWRHD